ncbi:MAG: helix-turn-helix domain-containing protein [Lentisphaeraceae bacterium]|nr:helix-turn-helix domain-containing protein [Lentisphaeraceae bacterium]
MNEEDNSIQQNLPLSWDDSDQNLEAEAPKKLLLRREPEEQVQEEAPAPKPLPLKRSQPEEHVQEDNSQSVEPQETEDEETYETDEDYENYEAQLDESEGDEEIFDEPEEHVQEEAPAPKPLLLKRAQPEEQQTTEDAELDEESIEELQTTEDAELDEESIEELQTTEEAELDEESIEELQTTEYAELDEEDIEEQHTTEDAELNEENHEIDYSEYDKEFEDNDNQETTDLDEEIDISEKYEEDSSLTALLEKEEAPLDESGTPLFQETGTFSLKHEPEEDDSDRLEIDSDVLDNVEEAHDESTESETSEEAAEKKLSAEEINAEESVFALKADTYYEVESTEPEEVQAEEEPIVDDAVHLDNTVTHETIHTLGALLQDARLSKSFTIKDASEATRIKNSYIIALENNDLDELPAKVYILNYIRQLAREYDIPHAPLIDAYEKQIGDHENGEQHFIRVGDDEARKATKPGGKLNALVVLTTVLLFGSIISLAYYKKWLSPQQSLEDHPPITISLEDLKEEISLPTPELPVPGGQ